MKHILAILMMLATSCACQGSQKEEGDEAKRDETIVNLVLVDPASPNMPSYPLMCVNGGDFPDGAELIYQKHNDPKKLVHAVFPKGIKAPDKLDGEILLRGHFQKIQNRDRFVYKKPPEDYQYFVVKSWAKDE